MHREKKQVLVKRQGLVIGREVSDFGLFQIKLFTDLFCFYFLLAPYSKELVTKKP